MVREYSEEIIKDGLLVLERAIKAIKKKQLLDLEALSNRVIHNATSMQDSISINISKILYGIFKLERQSMLKNTPLPLDNLADMLVDLHDHIGLGKITVFEQRVEKVIQEIERIGKDIHMENVIDRAGVKKGGKIYDHGISIAQAAEAMNISQWELYPYVAQAKLNEYPQDIDKRVKQRLAYTRVLFS